MPLTRKGTFMAILVLIIALGGGAYYVYRETGTFNISGIWNHWFAGSGQPGPVRLTDAETRAAVLESILKNPDLRSQAIEIEVSKDVVTLKGSVETPLQRAALEQLASSLAGSRTVRSTIAVRAATAGSAPGAAEDVDARLAKEVEFALYKTDAFEVKTLRISSQNHVIRLAGSVRSAAEKLLAERIAREVADVRGVVNELEVVK